MKMKSEDPWEGIEIPTSADLLTARRVSASMRWDFYWARDHERGCLLVLRHSGSSYSQRLPKFRGLEVRHLPGLGIEKARLVVRLLDPKLREIFARLCDDVLESAARCGTEEAVLEMVIARTWRWHYLLRGGSSGLLSLEEQKGLLGELHVLESYLIPLLGPAAAIECWDGPSGSAQDFSVAGMAIESKATASGCSRLMISSEFQLDDSEVGALTLHVCAFDMSEEEGAFSLTDVCQRVRDLVEPAGGAAVGRLEALLAAAGFRFDDDYSGSRWRGGERGIYRVGGEFPRLWRENVPVGIGNVRYSLEAEQCAAYLISQDAFRQLVTEALQ